MSVFARRMAIAKSTMEYLAKKEREPKYCKGFGGQQIVYYTYLVEVARFGEDFHQPPTIVPVQVRLSDNHYLQLLQWQLQNPLSGFNDYDSDISDIAFEIIYQVEDALYGDESVGTYAINLTEIRNDAEAIANEMKKTENQQ